MRRKRLPRVCSYRLRDEAKKWRDYVTKEKGQFLLLYYKEAYARVIPYCEEDLFGTSEEEPRVFPSEFYQLLDRHPAFLEEALKALAQMDPITLSQATQILKGLVAKRPSPPRGAPSRTQLDLYEKEQPQKQATTQPSQTSQEATLKYPKPRSSNPQPRREQCECGHVIVVAYRTHVMYQKDPYEDAEKWEGKAGEEMTLCCRDCKGEVTVVCRGDNYRFQERRQKKSSSWKPRRLLIEELAAAEGPA